MDLGLRTEITQKLSPQLMYSLKLLQYTAMELEIELKQKLEDNPMLEVMEDEEEEGDPASNAETESDPEEVPDPAAEKKEESEDIDWDEYLRDKNAKEEKELKEDNNEVDWDEYLKDGNAYEKEYQEQYQKDEDQNLLDREGKSGVSLDDYLLEQFYLLEITDWQREIGEYLIGNLEDDGLLLMSLEDIALVYKASVQSIEEVLFMIQTLDPVGIGARNLQESLLLQLEAIGKGDSLSATLISDHWDDLQNRRLAVIKKSLKASLEDIQGAIEIIARLNPKPGHSISDETAIPIIPDLVVEIVDDEFVVLINDKNLPRLRVSKLYHKLLNRNSKEPDEVRQYVRKKLNDANWLVHSIEQRRSTMLKVMNYIVDAQREFLEKGLRYLRPMILQDAADVIGIHPATVSRVTQGKYVQTPRGVFPLKYFFDGMISSSNGQQLATKSVKDQIAQLVREENPRTPLSDQKIVEILQNDGLDIARRTVAKYRDQLQIPKARMRKRV